MTQAVPELSLMGFLGLGLMQKVIRKRLFGAPYLHFADYVQVSGYLYQCGAILGRAKQDKLIILAGMLAQPGREADFIGYLKDLARKRLDDYVDTYGQQPTSLQLLVMTTEYKKAGVVMPLGVAEPATERELKTYMAQGTRIAKWKMPLKEIEPFMKTWGQEGIGFGSCFSDLTEKMYRDANEDIDIDQWSEARKHGLDLPETPSVITLEEQGQMVLSMAAVYAGTYFPDLVEPLGLTEVLRQAERNAEQWGEV